MGVVVVAGLTALHLLGSHWIGRGYLRKPLERWLEKRKYRLPELSPGEDASIALMAVLVPGPPYFVRNYLLAVSGYSVAHLLLGVAGLSTCCVHAW